MNKLTLIQLLNVANIPFLSYTDKVVFDELHECFLDENDCVAAEETWSDGCTLDDYVKEAGRNDL